MYRAQALLNVIKDRTGDYYGAFMRDMVNLRQVQDVLLVSSRGDKMTQEEVVMMVVASSLTHAQFDVLCKTGMLRDSSLKSSRAISDAMSSMAPKLPTIRFNTEGRGKHPGAMYDPEEYLPRALDSWVRSVCTSARIGARRPPPSSAVAVA